MNNSIHLDYSEIESVLQSVLLRHGFSDKRAGLCARLFTETSLDGVYSHGLNRFPQFIDSVQKGIVKPGNEPSLIRSSNNFETWDGNLGPGNLNAWSRDLLRNRVLDLNSRVTFDKKVFACLRCNKELYGSGIYKRGCTNEFDRIALHLLP